MTVELPLWGILNEHVLEFPFQICALVSLMQIIISWETCTHSD